MTSGSRMKQKVSGVRCQGVISKQLSVIRQMRRGVPNLKPETDT